MLDQQTNDEILVEMGRRLRSYRLQRNVTVADLAEQAGLNRNTVLNAEAGRDPRLSTLVAMLRVLGRLDALEAFLPTPPISPLQLVKLRAQQRQRASKAKVHG